MQYSFCSTLLGGAKYEFLYFETSQLPVIKAKIVKHKNIMFII